MPLPAPNLDDRRFQDLVDDAKRLVQRRCPEWTDHNVSDPGVTLIETFAYLVDQVLYRLNRVPERSYVTFLDLMGVELFPPGGGARPGDVLADRPAGGGPRRRGRHRGRHPAPPHRRGAGVPHDRRPRHPALPADVRDDRQRRRPAVRPVGRARQRAAGRRVLGRAAGGRRAVRRARSRRAALRRGDPRRVRLGGPRHRPDRSAVGVGGARPRRLGPLRRRGRHRRVQHDRRHHRPRPRVARRGGARGALRWVAALSGASRRATSTSRSTRRARCCWPSTPRRSAGRRRRCTARTSSTSWSASSEGVPGPALHPAAAAGRRRRAPDPARGRRASTAGSRGSRCRGSARAASRRPALAAQRHRRHARVRAGRAPRRRLDQAVRRGAAGRRPRPRAPLPHRRRSRRQRRRPRDRHAEVGAPVHRSRRQPPSGGRRRRRRDAGGGQDPRPAGPRHAQPRRDRARLRAAGARGDAAGRAGALPAGRRRGPRRRPTPTPRRGSACSSSRPCPPTTTGASRSTSWCRPS